MTSLEERAALVALLRTAKGPWARYADVVEERSGARAALAEEQGLFAHELIDAAAADISRWAAEGLELLTLLDPGYPENLRAAHDRPPLIFVAGHLTPGDARAVAVVGARRASDHGLEQATAVAAELVRCGFTVTSGLAAGVDTAAHTAAQAHGGRTIAVVGTGLRRCYPPENEPLQRRIARECAVISQFWPDAPPSKRSFPMRNAVMSGLTLASVIVEASDTSGARIQARLALGQGRPVFLLHTLLKQRWAREYAARPGTHVVESPREITATVERLTASGTLVA